MANTCGQDQINKEQLELRKYKFSFDPERWNAEFKSMFENKFLGLIVGKAEKFIDINVKHIGFRSIAFTGETC